METNNIETKVIKIGFLGSSLAGKTSIIQRFMGLEFCEDNLSTVGLEKSEKKFRVKNNEDIKLVIWDSAGQERFCGAAIKNMRAADGIIFVISVTDSCCFDHHKLWYDAVKNNLNNPITILFANHIDNDSWNITEEEICKYAKEKELAYFLTSAKNDKGINEGFSYIINEIYDKKYGNKNNDNIDNNNNNIIIKENNKKKNKSGCLGSKKKK